MNHSILLKNLEHYGVRGIPLQWFWSYLSGRQQYVSVAGNLSETLEISCGIPQGSMLGPLLFLLYINDLPKISNKLTFFLFADDTNIYYESSSLLDIQKSVNKELRKVCKWLESNRLVLTLDKTNFIIFHSTQNKPETQINIKFGRKSEPRNLCQISWCSTGFYWKPHLTELSKKLSRTVGLFYKIRHIHH